MGSDHREEQHDTTKPLGMRHISDDSRTNAAGCDCPCWRVRLVAYADFDFPASCCPRAAGAARVARGRRERRPGRCFHRARRFRPRQCATARATAALSRRGRRLRPRASIRDYRSDVRCAGAIPRYGGRPQSCQATTGAGVGDPRASAVRCAHAAVSGRTRGAAVPEFVHALRRLAHGPTAVRAAALLGGMATFAEISAPSRSG